MTNTSDATKTRPKLPHWIRVRAGAAGSRDKVGKILRDNSLNTVCESARCPNISECWEKQRATFMILGENCTRKCRFCAVGHEPDMAPPDPSEPANLAKAAKEMGLDYVVITSVTRDDLADGGAAHFASVIREIRKAMPGCEIEVLTPDFKGLRKDIKTVLDEKPSVFNHNLETVERLTPGIRSGADYRRSLDVLRMACEESAGKVRVKSGIMAGLGESDSEIIRTISDIRRTGASILTIGQYLPPLPDSWNLDRYLHPEKFKEFADFAFSIGFASVASAPLVRSSFNAEESFKKSINSKGAICQHSQSC